MSLLMDALRKAEEQKQSLAGPGGTAREDGGLALEPIAAAAPDVSRRDPGSDALPELPARLEDLDEQFLAHASSPPPKGTRATSRPAKEPASAPTPAPAPDHATDVARASARMVFEAKQPPADKNSFAIVVGLATLIAVIGIGGYVWWEMQPKGGLVTIGAPAPNTPPALPVAPPAALQLPVNPAPAVAPAPTLAESAAIPTLPAEEAVAASATWRPAVAPPPSPPPAAAKPESPIRLTTSVLKTDPLLERAWQAFNQGEFDLARANWQKVFAADPRNASALHGLAALAQQRQQPDTAADYYLRALEIDPKDALALSALVSLKAPVDVRQMESRMKSLLVEQPESPYLNFALGNLYARELRWAEAQQAFFRAHAADPPNPDYLFNLAVSLDQLHKPQLAAQYYNQALAAAARQPAGFDTIQVAARLNLLRAGPRP